MKTAFISINNSTIDANKITKALFDKGHDAYVFLQVSSENLDEALESVRKTCGAIVLDGDTDVFIDTLSTKYKLTDKPFFELDQVLYIYKDVIDIDFVNNVILPTLDHKSKTIYNAAVYKTFGLKLDVLQERLKNVIRNKNRIVIKLFQEGSICEVHARYSLKTAKTAVDETLAKIFLAVHDRLFAISNATLAEAVALSLIKNKLKIKIAESFTGGALSSELVSIEGASRYLIESFVTYSNEAKQQSLGVDPLTIQRYGAVSKETAYNMAAGLLNGCESDIVIATTGNAGPTCEKPNDVGHCFIAVGNKEAIHIVEYFFKGTRKQIIEQGVQNALYRVYEYIQTITKINKEV